MQPHKSTRLVRVILVLASCAGNLVAGPLGTVFTYQGRLQDGAGPANGLYDLELMIYDAAGGGNPASIVFTRTATPVSNGLFTATLDFGDGVFIGAARWLEIGVRSNGSVAGFTLLSPRQPLTAAPYALYAPQAGSAGVAGALAGTLPASQLTGTVPDARLSSNVALLASSPQFSGTVTAAGFVGDGQRLTNLNIEAMGPPGTFVLYPSGQFTPVTVPVGTFLPGQPMINMVEAADVNRDGVPELIAAQLTENKLAVIVRTPAGGFVVSNTLAGVSQPAWVTAADVNHDSWPDLIAAHYDR